MRCIGTTAKSESGNIIGAISVSGPNSAMSMDRLTETLAEQLQGTANVIELKVAYSQWPRFRMSETQPVRRVSRRVR